MFGVAGVMLDVDGVAHMVYEFLGVVFSYLILRELVW